MQHNHHFSSYPPREAPAVLLKTKEAYVVWLGVRKNLKLLERIGVGDKIESNFLSLLEIIFLSSYSSFDQKVDLLDRAITKVDILKFFIQLIWENKHITTQKQIELLDKLMEIGRQLGGWKKGLQTKTPQA